MIPAAPAPTADRTIWSLQYLRFAAATLVVLLHASGGLRQAGYSAQPHFDVGNAGVDIFFVVSGFVIAWTTFNKGAADRAGYFRSRAVRVLPLYYLATVAAFFVLRGGENASGVGDLIKSLLFIPIHVANSARFTATYGPGWTLDYEVAFYIIFGLALVLTPDRRVRLVIAVMFAAAAVGAIAQPSGIAAFYTDPIVAEFAAGVALAFWVRSVARSEHSLPRKELLLVHAVAWIVLIAPGATRDDLGHWRALVWGLPALVIVATAVLLETSAGGVPRSRWLHQLGDASYAIYISHLFVLRIGGEIWKRAHLTTKLPSGALFGLLVIAATVVGVALDRFIDQPIRQLLLRGTAKKAT